MITKASASVLNLVSPPIPNLVLLEGTFDDVVIGAHVPNEAIFTELTDTSLASPLVGAPTGLLSGVFLGTGLAMSGNVLYVVFAPVSPPVSPAPSPGFVLREDGSDLLREDDSKIEREHPGT